ncbi:MAG: hypothetical protein HND47_13625 [Chloroflexi bacterium]|nr:hypothetical protein [Chloroflexota bacterium]
MGTVIAVILGVAILGGAVLLAVVGARFARRAQEDQGDPVLARLAEATQRGENVSLEDIELQQPFMERVVIPIIRKIGELSVRFTPEKLLQETALKLELAGNPGRIDAATFLATRFVGAALFGGLLLLIGNLPTVDWLRRACSRFPAFLRCWAFSSRSCGSKAGSTAVRTKSAKPCRTRSTC